MWWVPAAGPWDPGLWQLSATLPTLQPLLQLWPRQRLLCCFIKNCLPIHLSVHISIPLWLSDFGCFHTPDQQWFGIFLRELTPFQPFLLEHAGPSRVREAGTLKWEQVERASRELKTGIRFKDRQKILGTSPEGPGHCLTLLLTFLLYPFSCSFFFYYYL